MQGISATFFTLKIRAQSESEMNNIIAKIGNNSFISAAKPLNNSNTDFHIYGFTLKDCLSTILWIAHICGFLENKLNIVPEVKLGQPLADNVVTKCCRIKL
jgi:hypothetical protein